ncbi:YueI family protein [Lacticaseibacillus absianus]|uniref:YueI family protein n=1 Tax=Lacticaseibacillus absianus TaxID=2729623 RepID=UPI0015C795CB|nr:YueI family protein [Lacticaseibacillus absianus]
MADQDDLQTRLNNRLYGAPQTNPDERRHYLGSLRERAALFITNDEMTTAAALPAVKRAIATHRGDPHFKLLLNGKLSPALTAPFMAAANQADFPFTLVNDETASEAATGCGALITSDQAIEQSEIRLTTTPPKPQDQDKPTGFFARFFD